MYPVGNTAYFLDSPCSNRKRLCLQVLSNNFSTIFVEKFFTKIGVFVLRNKFFFICGHQALKKFMGHRRLRRSGVALQHVSAHFGVAKRTSDFIFQFSFTQLVKFLIGWGGYRRGRFNPTSLVDRTKFVPHSCNIGLKSDPLSVIRSHWFFASAHLRAFALCWPDGAYKLELLEFVVVKFSS